MKTARKLLTGLMNTLDVLLQHCLIGEALPAVFADPRTVRVAHRLQVILVRLDRGELFAASLAHRLDERLLFMRFDMRQVLLIP